MLLKVDQCFGPVADASQPVAELDLAVRALGANLRPSHLRGQQPRRSTLFDQRNLVQLVLGCLVDHLKPAVPQYLSDRVVPRWTPFRQRVLAITCCSGMKPRAR